MGIYTFFSLDGCLLFRSLHVTESLLISGCGLISGGCGLISGGCRLISGGVG